MRSHVISGSDIACTTQIYNKFNKTNITFSMLRHCAECMNDKKHYKLTAIVDKQQGRKGFYPCDLL